MPRRIKKSLLQGLLQDMEGIFSPQMLGITLHGEHRSKSGRHKTFLAQEGWNRRKKLKVSHDRFGDTREELEGVTLAHPVRTYSKEQTIY